MELNFFAKRANSSVSKQNENDLVRNKITRLGKQERKNSRDYFVLYWYSPLLFGRILKEGAKIEFPFIIYSPIIDLHAAEFSLSNIKLPFYALLSKWRKKFLACFVVSSGCLTFKCVDLEAYMTPPPPRKKYNLHFTFFNSVPYLWSSLFKHLLYA